MSHTGCSVADTTPAGSRSALFGRLGRLALVALCIAANPARARSAPEHAPTGLASYHVRMVPGSFRLHVSATVPIAGRDLLMADSWPALIPELDSLGWCGLVSGLAVTDGAGRRLDVAVAGANRWRLATPDTGTVELHYEVDYPALGRRGWPAPREAASADSTSLALVGRSLFIITPGAHACEVTFALPPGWRAVTAWSARRGQRSTFDVASSDELVENLCVLTRSAPDEVVAGNFHLHVIAQGQWASSRAEVRSVLAPIIRYEVAMMGLDRPVNYVVVLLPLVERGGESYRHSFALSVAMPPSASTRTDWGNLVAHEIFHLWNGWRLHGEDYATTQWFQEGFTEYAANTALVRSGLVSPADFLGLLSTHLRDYRRLATSLEGIGTHKGPPLYGGGALVAFSWDVMIRRATSGRRTLADFWREFLREADGGRRAYAWKDLRAALERTAPGDWEAYYQANVRGPGPLPLEALLPAAGLHVSRAESGAERLEEDPDATAASRRLWRQMVTTN